MSKTLTVRELIKELVDKSADLDAPVKGKMFGNRAFGIQEVSLMKNCQDEKIKAGDIILWIKEIK